MYILCDVFTCAAVVFEFMVIRDVLRAFEFNSFVRILTPGHSANVWTRSLDSLAALEEEEVLISLILL